MKKIILLFLLVLPCFASTAQMTSLTENFDVCDSVKPGNGPGGAHASYFPPGWYSYSAIGAQEWLCYPQYGVNNTACVQANGYVFGTDYTNEQWLITPQLTLSAYTNIYLNFFANYSYPGDSLHIMISNNYTGSGDPAAAVWNELSHPYTNMFDDSAAGFRQFQVDLSSYKSTPLYIAFKYVSSVTACSRWHLDSVFTTTTLLGGPSGVKAVVLQNLPLTVIGQSTSNIVKVGFNANQGQYTMSIFDMVGRKVYSQVVFARGGDQTMILNNVQLRSGMYIVKMSDENVSGLTKFTVE